MLIELVKLKDVLTQLSDCHDQLASLENKLKKINELQSRSASCPISFSDRTLVVVHLQPSTTEGKVGD